MSWSVCQAILLSSHLGFDLYAIWHNKDPCVGVAHFVQDCFEVLGALDDAPDDASTSSSSALAAG